ncbi:MAG: AMP-binding protein, partial [Myxococcota bacterium]
MASDTIVHRLLQQANAQPHATAYSEKVGDDWKACTWQEYAKQVRRAARALLSLGVGRKQSRDPHHADLDQSAPCVAILGFNAPEWNVLALATMAVGGAPAGIYTTNAPSEVAYIVGHTEARVVLVENAEQWAKIAQTRDELPYLEKVVLMRGSEAVDDPMVLTWEAFLAQADETADEVLDEYIEALEPDGLATLIYTSGT